MNPIFTSTALKAILNNAPVIIQGASKLLQVIKENKTRPQDQETPTPQEDRQEEMERLQQRLDATDESNIAQIKLIEELARQNADIADSLDKTYKRLNLVTLLAIVALILGLSVFLMGILRP